MNTTPPKSPLSIAVLISGGGTTLRNLIEKIDEGSLDVEIKLVIASSSKARGLRFAEEASISSSVIRRKDFADDGAFGDSVFDACRAAAVDLVALCGFLKFLPVPDDFAGRVMNIHPALIPAFCGKGYYGHHVHEAVLEKGAKVSGCTVHFVDNQYDHGPIIVQRTVPVRPGDTADTLAVRVFDEECEAYPEALRLFAAGRLRIDGQVVRVGNSKDAGVMKFRIDHVAIWTTDLEKLKSFYATHFGAIAGEKYTNPRSGFQSYFLAFAGGPRLEIMTGSVLVEADRAGPRPGYAHLALSVGTKNDVDVLTERLRAAGVRVVDGPRRTGDGSYESVVLDPDGNHVEITE